MTTAGDVNGDGFEDMIVSAIDHSNPEETNGEEGKLYLFNGGPDGLSATPSWEFESNNDSSVLGFSTSGGDLNGDGYSDIVAGALQWTGDQYSEGRIYFWYGSPTGPSTGEPDWSIDFDQAQALVGSGAALDGDLNGDGYNDLFFSAKMWDEPEAEEGKVWLYWGSAGGPVFSGWTWQPDQEGAIAGFPINYAGDVNGDGYEDVIIGVNGYDSVQQDDGMIALFYGGPGVPSASPDWTGTGGQKKCNFGHWTDGAGDVNGDGYDDIIASALLYESEIAEGSEGRVFVFHGGPDGPSNTADWFGEINQLQAQLGYSCAGAGDINNDGYDDVIGGAKYWDNGNLDEGGAFVWFGGPDGIETNYCWEGGGDQDSAYYGRHVGGACDFNNDGYADFLVGAYRFTELLEADGKGFVYYGGPREGDFHFDTWHFCMDGDDPVAILDGLPGGFFSGSAVIDPETGAVDLDATGAGTFTITYTPTSGCAITHTFDIENTATTDWMYYAEDTICIGFALAPDFFGGTEGYFYSAENIVDSLTGNIIADTSMVGTHVIYYSGYSVSGCAFTDAFTLTLLPAPEISFAQDIFCQTDSFAFAEVNMAGGEFYSDDVLIDLTGGAINLYENSVGGPYEIYYVYDDVCPIASTTLSIDTADNSLAAFVYPDDSICNNAEIQYPIPAVLPGGWYTCAGGSVDAISGALDPTLFEPGTYTIVYSVFNGVACMLYDTVSIVILPAPDATFYYGDATLFIGDPVIIPVITDTGGIFSAAPEGLSIDSLSGAIYSLASDTGTYIIQYLLVDSYCPDVYFDTITIYPACVAPDSTFVTEITDSSALVSWTPVEGYYDYLLTINGPPAPQYFETSDTSFLVTGLAELTYYDITVTTLCAEDSSATGDLISILTEKTVSVSGWEDPLFIYPNPFTDQLIIRGQDLHNRNVQLFSSDGRSIAIQTLLAGNKIILQTANLIPGVYFIRIEAAPIPFCVIRK